MHPNPILAIFLNIAGRPKEPACVFKLIELKQVTVYLPICDDGLSHPYQFCDNFSFLFHFAMKIM